MDVIRHQPFTCTIVTLYASNVLWNLTQGRWGQAMCWSAALQITITATWLMGWKS